MSCGAAKVLGALISERFLNSTEVHGRRLRRSMADDNLAACSWLLMAAFSYFPVIAVLWRDCEVLASMQTIR
jgi:hypothetical protein